MSTSLVVGRIRIARKSATRARVTQPRFPPREHRPVRKVTVAERRARLARRHLLAPGTQTDDVPTIADALVGLHSSDPVTVYLSAAARMAHPSIGAVC